MKTILHVNEHKKEKKKLFFINNNGRLAVKATAHQRWLPKKREKKHI